jgi:phospholipase A1/A2
VPAANAGSSGCGHACLSGPREGGAAACAAALLLPVLLAAAPLCAQPSERSLALVPLSSTVEWDAELDLEVLLANRGPAAIAFPLGAKVRARLWDAGESWPLTLTRDGTAALPARIAPHGFAAVRYHAVLPPQAHGRAFLVLEEPGVERARAVIDIIGGGTDGPSIAGAWNGDFDHQRQLVGRLSINQPIYIIAGVKEPEAKFQVSFKYRLSSLGASSDNAPPHSLQLGYTQRSLWEFGPFYDTSYMPEIMYQWSPKLDDTPSAGGVTWLGLQAGWLHESNGRGDGNERAANMAYVRPVISIGSAAGWHAMVQPMFWFYFLGMHSNPDLYVYRGNSALITTVGRADGTSLKLTWLPGEHFAYGSRQLDLSIPVHLPFLDISTYVMVQYFDGYAESLIAYQQHTSVVRAGLEFVR